MSDTVEKEIAKGGHSDLGKVFQVEDGLLAVVFLISNVMVGHAGKGIGLGVGFTRAVNQGEVKAGEVQGPSALTSAKVLSCVPILQIVVISDDLERQGKTFQEMLPVLECLNDSEHLLVVNLVVALSYLHGSGTECNGVPEVIVQFL